jgi:hypothetical protein
VNEPGTLNWINTDIWDTVHQLVAQANLAMLPALKNTTLDTPFRYSWPDEEDLFYGPQDEDVQGAVKKITSTVPSRESPIQLSQTTSSSKCHPLMITLILSKLFKEAGSLSL